MGDTNELIKRRIMIKVAYDGTDFHGWQFQKGQRTVEGVLNEALTETLKEDIEVIGASRTDAGVHSMGNIAVFDTCGRIPAEKVPYALNQKLPGDVTITVTYSVSDDNEFKIAYDAVSTQKTVINLTSHMYLNLNGHYKGSIENHVLTINADYYNPVIDSKSIPTEENAPVEGTVFDFRTPKPIGRDIEADNQQLQFVGGYDHNYVINGNTGDMRLFATAYSPDSGIFMEFSSDQTGTQLYSGNFIGEQVGKGGFNYHKRSGFCLEPQYIPNAMNFIEEGNVDSPIFDADERYHSVSCFKFSVK